MNSPTEYLMKIIINVVDNIQIEIKDVLPIKMYA